MKPNPNFDHAFAILRLDSSHDPSMKWVDILADHGRLYSHLVTVKKVVWEAEEAESEVARLNQLNSETGCVYFHQVTRVQRRANKSNG